MGLGNVTLDDVVVRFVADSGAALSFEIGAIHVGTPAAWAACQRNEKRVDWGTPYGNVEWLRWKTYRSAHGETLVVRRDGPPPEGTPRPEDTVHFLKGTRKPKAVRCG